MHKQTKRHSGGFTLIETLAAGIILALAGAVLGTAVTQNMRSLATARDYQRAAELLDRILTKIDLVGPAKLLSEGPTSGTFTAPYDRFSWDATIESRPDGYLYDVTVRIIWRTGRGNMRSVEAETYLNDPLEASRSRVTWEEL